MKLRYCHLLAYAVSIALANFTTAPAEAAQTCKVATRDRSSLTIYDSPDSSSVNALRFGREVQIQDSARGNEGRTWVKVSGNHNGEYRQWGWVIKQYLDCGNSSQSKSSLKMVTVYGRMSCPYTARMIQQLSQNGIPHIFKDTSYADVNREASQRASSAGISFSGVPLVYINKNQWVRVGPQPDAVISQYRNY